MTSELEKNPYVRALLDMDAEVVPASAISPIIRMHPSVMIDYVRSGEWNLCQTIQSGDHVKFFRRDFLRKSGLIDEDTDLLIQIRNELKELRNEIAELKGAETT